MGQAGGLPHSHYRVELQRKYKQAAFGRCAGCIAGKQALHWLRHRESTIYLVKTITNQRDLKMKAVLLALLQSKATNGRGSKR